MKEIGKMIIVAVAITGLVGISSAVAQGGRGPGNRMYDPKTVETVEGTVASVEKAASPQGRGGQGVHLTLKTADNPGLGVRLGPAWYVDKQTLHIEANDAITVTGSRVTIGGKPVIIAAEIKKGADVLTLRDKNGVPAWAGRGRSGQ
jgi:hypothetical protein